MLAIIWRVWTLDLTSYQDLLVEVFPYQIFRIGWCSTNDLRLGHGFEPLPWLLEGGHPKLLSCSLSCCGGSLLLQQKKFCTKKIKRIGWCSVCPFGLIQSNALEEWLFQHGWMVLLHYVVYTNLILYSEFPEYLN